MRREACAQLSRNHAVQRLRQRDPLAPLVRLGAASVEPPYGHHADGRPTSGLLIASVKSALARSTSPLAPWAFPCSKTYSEGASIPLGSSPLRSFDRHAIVSMALSLLRRWLIARFTNGPAHSGARRIAASKSARAPSMSPTFVRTTPAAVVRTCVAGIDRDCCCAIGNCFSVPTQAISVTARAKKTAVLWSPHCSVVEKWATLASNSPRSLRTFLSESHSPWHSRADRPVAYRTDGDRRCH